MRIQRLPAEEAAVERVVEELWLPYNRELESTVEQFALADDVDLVAEEVPFRRDRLEDDGYRAWVAVDASQTTGEETSADATPATDVATTDATLAGFVTTELDESPSVFARPDRLVIGDLYVCEPYRSSGLAEQLVDRARTRARECGCGEVTLEVDVDNDRARAFYRKLGFETYRLVQSLPVE